MVSMPAFAADGAWGDCRAYGSTLEQASGLPSVSGRPDGPPAINHIALWRPDRRIARRGGHAGRAAAPPPHRRRANRIDMSQVECMLTLVAPWIAEQSANGRVAPRMGARHPGHVPHNCFPCERRRRLGLLVAADDDGNGRRCAGAIGPRRPCRRPGLGHVSTAAARREHEIEAAVARLDATADGRRRPCTLLQQPRRRRRRGALAARSAGGSASRGARILAVDRARVRRPASRSPRRPIARTGARIAIARPAPTLASTIRRSCRGVLGLTQDELDRLARAGVIGNQAVPPNMRKARAAVG